VDADLAGAGDVGEVQFPLGVGDPLGPFQRTQGLLFQQFRGDVFQDAFTEPAQVVGSERRRLGDQVLFGLDPDLGRRTCGCLGDDTGLLRVDGAGGQRGVDDRHTGGKCVRQGL
jgi:hypothetical protein